MFGLTHQAHSLTFSWQQIAGDENINARIMGGELGAAYNLTSHWKADATLAYACRVAKPPYWRAQMPCRWVVDSR